MTVSIEARRRALEELRTADRIIGGALGTLEFVGRQQGLDALGFQTADGLYGEATRADVASAQSELNEAQLAFRRALEHLGTNSGDWTDLEQWGYAEGVIDGVFDLFAVLKAQRNIEAAKQVHAKVRDLYSHVAASDPSFADLPPLADWEDEGFKGEMLALWQFNKPAFLLRAARIGMIVIGAIVLVITLIRQLLG